MVIRCVFQFHGPGTPYQRTDEFKKIIGRAVRRGFRDDDGRFLIPRLGRNQKSVRLSESGSEVLAVFQYQIWGSKGTESFLQMPVEIRGCPESVPDDIREAYIRYVFRFLTYGRPLSGRPVNLYLETFTVNGKRIRLPEDPCYPLDTEYRDFRAAAYEES